jgi:uncharacterized protein YabN with tetrapyrrole methylase and pyrophosphatase domain
MIKENSQLFTAGGIMRAYPDSSFHLTVTGLEKTNAASVTERLMRFYGADAPVTVSRDGKDIGTELSRAGSEIIKLGDGAVLSVPPAPEFNKGRYNFQDLFRIMDRLIAPDGCPWDREQTHGSIAKNAVEEANELNEAISLSDTENIKKEAGDVLLQGVFHGVIAEKYGGFTAEDVIDALCGKLISRHTHVFGSDKAESACDALNFWKAAKAKEKSTGKK